MAEINWIKIKTDMFDDEKIKLIERMPEGDMILVIWMKLLTYAGKVNCNGYIMISENIPMNLEEMAIIFNRPIEKVRYAIQVLERYRMIELEQHEMVSISNWEKHQNIDGMEKIRKQNAERVRRHREKKKQLLLGDSNVNSNVNVTLRNGIEREEEEEEDKESDKDKRLRDKKIKEKEEEKERKEKDTPSSLVDQDFILIKQHLEEKICYREASYSECKRLSDMLDDYQDPKLIIIAMDVANEMNKPNIAYINAILNNWKNDGIVNHKQYKAMVEVKHRSGTNRTSSKLVADESYDNLSI